MSGIIQRNRLFFIALVIYITGAILYRQSKNLEAGTLYYVVMAVGLVLMLLGAFLGAKMLVRFMKEAYRKKD